MTGRRVASTDPVVAADRVAKGPLATARSAVRSRGGFVLIATLWLIVALSAVALDAALRSQPERLAAANRLDEARAREAALAGGEYARARLSEAMLERTEELRAEVARQSGTSGRRPNLATLLFREDPWHDPQGLVPAGMALGGAEFRLAVQDAGVSFNINEATEDMLRAFLSQGLRVDYAEADRLTQAILDWRDEDDLPRLNGGEADEYVDAGLPVLPGNRPFASVEEVRHVLGMTTAIFEALRPFVSVVGSGRINVNAAPEPVLYAIPEFTVAAVAGLLRLREAGTLPRSATELDVLLGPAFRAPTGREAGPFNRRVTYATNEVEIVSAGRTEGSQVEVVVRTIVARADVGALVLWRRVE
jgi:type II secretory pathway component PulK